MTNSFTPAYALKSYADGALYRVYPGGWAVWREAAVAGGYERVFRLHAHSPSPPLSPPLGLPRGRYELVYSSSRRPSGDEVEELLAPDDGSGGGGGGLAAFIKGFQAM